MEAIERVVAGLEKRTAGMNEKEKEIGRLSRVGARLGLQPAALTPSRCSSSRPATHALDGLHEVAIHHLVGGPCARRAAPPR